MLKSARADGKYAILVRDGIIIDRFKYSLNDSGEIIQDPDYDRLPPPKRQQDNRDYAPLATHQPQRNAWGTANQPTNQQRQPQQYQNHYYTPPFAQQQQGYAPLQQGVRQTADLNIDTYAPPPPARMAQSQIQYHTPPPAQHQQGYAPLQHVVRDSADLNTNTYAPPPPDRAAQPAIGRQRPNHTGGMYDRRSNAYEYY